MSSEDPSVARKKSSRQREGSPGIVSLVPEILSQLLREMYYKQNKPPQRLFGLVGPVYVCDLVVDDL